MADEVVTKQEIQVGVVARLASRAKRFKTADDLAADYADNPHEYTPVNYKDRVEFLEKNGYAVNRRNLTNSGLSHKPEALQSQDEQPAE